MKASRGTSPLTRLYRHKSPKRPLRQSASSFRKSKFQSQVPKPKPGPLATPQEVPPITRQPSQDDSPQPSNSSSSSPTKVSGILRQEELPPGLFSIPATLTEQTKSHSPKSFQKNPLAKTEPKFEEKFEVDSSWLFEKKLKRSHSFGDSFDLGSSKEGMVSCLSLVLEEYRKEKSEASPEQSASPSSPRSETKGSKDTMKRSIDELKRVTREEQKKNSKLETKPVPARESSMDIPATDDSKMEIKPKPVRDDSLDRITKSSFEMFSKKSSKTELKGSKDNMKRLWSPKRSGGREGAHHFLKRKKGDSKSQLRTKSREFSSLAGEARKTDVFSGRRVSSLERDREREPKEKEIQGDDESFVENEEKDDDKIESQKKEENESKNQLLAGGFTEQNKNKSFQQQEESQQESVGEEQPQQRENSSQQEGEQTTPKKNTIREYWNRKALKQIRDISPRKGRKGNSVLILRSPKTDQTSLRKTRSQKKNLEQKSQPSKTPSPSPLSVPSSPVPSRGIPSELNFCLSGPCCPLPDSPVYSSDGPFDPSSSSEMSFPSPGQCKRMHYVSPARGSSLSPSLISSNTSSAQISVSLSTSPTSTVTCFTSSASSPPSPCSYRRSCSPKISPPCTSPPIPVPSSNSRRNLRPLSINFPCSTSSNSSSLISPNSNSSSQTSPLSSYCASSPPFSSSQSSLSNPSVSSLPSLSNRPFRVLPSGQSHPKLPRRISVTPSPPSPSSSQISSTSSPASLYQSPSPITTSPSSLPLLSSQNSPSAPSSPVSKKSGLFQGDSQSRLRSFTEGLSPENPSLKEKVVLESDSEVDPFSRFKTSNTSVKYSPVQARPASSLRASTSNSPQSLRTSTPKPALQREEKRASQRKRELKELKETVQMISKVYLPMTRKKGTKDILNRAHQVNCQTAVLGEVGIRTLSQFLSCDRETTRTTVFEAISVLLQHQSTIELILRTDPFCFDFITSLVSCDPMWKNFPNIRFFVCQSLLSFSRFLKKEGKKERGERKKKRKSYLGLKRYSNFSKLNEEEFWGTEIDFGEKKLKEKIYLDMEREKKEKEEEKGRNQKKRIDDSLSVRHLLLGIGEKMKQPTEKMEKYITILEKNWFDSVGSLKDLGSADYEKMEFPLRLSVEIQKQINSLPTEEKQDNQKDISLDQNKIKLLFLEATPFKLLLSLRSFVDVQPLIVEILYHLHQDSDFLLLYASSSYLPEFIIFLSSMAYICATTISPEPDSFPVPLLEPLPTPFGDPSFSRPLAEKLGYFVTSILIQLEIQYAVSRNEQMLSTILIYLLVLEKMKRFPSSPFGLCALRFVAMMLEELTSESDFVLRDYFLPVHINSLFDSSNLFVCSFSTLFSPAWASYESLFRSKNDPNEREKERQFDFDPPRPDFYLPPPSQPFSSPLPEEVISALHILSLCFSTFFNSSSGNLYFSPTQGPPLVRSHRLRLDGTIQEITLPSSTTPTQLRVSPSFGQTSSPPLENSYLSSGGGGNLQSPPKNLPSFRAHSPSRSSSPGIPSPVLSASNQSFISLRSGSLRASSRENWGGRSREVEEKETSSSPFSFLGRRKQAGNLKKSTTVKTPLSPTQRETTLKRLAKSLGELIRLGRQHPRVSLSASYSLYVISLEGDEEEVDLVAEQTFDFVMQSLISVPESAQQFLILLLRKQIGCLAKSNSAALLTSSFKPLLRVPEAAISFLFRSLTSDTFSDLLKKEVAHLIASLTTIAELKPLISSFATLSSIKSLADFGVSPQLYKPIPFSSLELKEKIGQGAVGAVYAATYESNRVAVKMFDQESLGFSMEEFLIEVTVMSVLRHPNLVGAYGASITLPRLFIVCPIFDNGCLADLLTLYRPLPFSLVCSIALDIANGMNYLHQSGVVHCDLKPQNILLDEKNRAYICDFGNTRFQGHTSKDVAGTMIYSAPEVVAGLSEMWDSSVDVYSFAVVLWEVYHGKVPYLDHAKESHVYNLVCSGFREEINPALVPEAMTDLITICWDQDPAKRMTFAEILTKLHVFKQMGREKKNCLPFHRIKVHDGSSPPQTELSPVGSSSSEILFLRKKSLLLSSSGGDLSTTEKKSEEGDSTRKVLLKRSNSFGDPSPSHPPFWVGKIPEKSFEV